MSIKLDPTRTPCVISLAGEVNIRCAVKLKEVLIEALSLKRDLRIDLTCVTEIDITALQLLWSAEREAQTTGRSFTLDQSVPEVILAVLNRARLNFPRGEA